MADLHTDQHSDSPWPGSRPNEIPWPIRRGNHAQWVAAVAACFAAIGTVGILAYTLLAVSPIKILADRAILEDQKMRVEIALDDAQDRLSKAEEEIAGLRTGIEDNQNRLAQLRHLTWMQNCRLYASAYGSSSFLKFYELEALVARGVPIRDIVAIYASRSQKRTPLGALSLHRSRPENRILEDDEQTRFDRFLGDFMESHREMLDFPLDPELTEDMSPEQIAKVIGEMDGTSEFLNTVFGGGFEPACEELAPKPPSEEPIDGG